MEKPIYLCDNQTTQETTGECVCKCRIVLGNVSRRIFIIFLLDKSGKISYIPTMKETEPKKKIEAYMKRTGLKAYQIADLAKIPRVSIYRFLSGSRDLKLSQWRSVLRLIDRQ